MKLELKHIAPYLPYKLKVKDTKNDCTWELHPYKDALDNLEDNEHLSVENFFNEIKIYRNDPNIQQIHKPILRPLSDLYMEDSNGNWLADNYRMKQQDEHEKVWRWWGIIMEGGTLNLQKYVGISPAPIFNLLIENHFDVFGLIEKGLAISTHDVYSGAR